VTHKLSRQIRFSVNPFLDDTEQGGNSHASKPCGQGLSLYFALWVELASNVDPETGFVVNVVEIDRQVRQYITPIFTQHVKKRYRQGQHISLAELTGLLHQSWAAIKDKFVPAELRKIRLDLNPNRNIAILTEDSKVMYYSEKFEFAAMHKLWNPGFSDEKNFDIFGKCANPSGHGHNYIAEITVAANNPDDGFEIGKFSKAVDKHFIQLVDHKNLNIDVEEFTKKSQP
jgi:6-pyruvoyltetrahydropterin/6-carboxytetrahydropterin synthase